jgi:alanyl-tRNA synthetase
MGVDRTVAVLNGYDDIFRIETVQPLVHYLEELSGRAYAETPRPFRIISDHVRAAVMAIADGARPSNVDAGYVVRRMVRRAVVYAHQLGITQPFFGELSAVVLDIFSPVYPEIANQRDSIAQVLEQEAQRFEHTLERGLKQYHRVVGNLRENEQQIISAEQAFDLFQTYGFPLPLTVELAEQADLEVDEAGFEHLLAEHQEISRRGMDKKFGGGLGDHTEQSTRYHTATHLLHAALRQVLGTEAGVRQMGSNITPERLRFDFAAIQKLTPEQLQRVEALVNQQIQRDLPVSYEVLPREAALNSGALAFFGEKYGEQVKVYSIGDFSKEVCGGPHVAHTAELGSFRIVKEEAVGRGVRRIRAVLE